MVFSHHRLIFQTLDFGSGRVSDLGQFYFSIVDTEMIETLSILEAPDVVLQELVLLHTVCRAPVCHHRLRMIAQKCSYKMVHGFSPKKMISLQTGHILELTTTVFIHHYICIWGPYKLIWT